MEGALGGSRRRRVCSPTEERARGRCVAGPAPRLAAGGGGRRTCSHTRPGDPAGSAGVGIGEPGSDGSDRSDGVDGHRRNGIRTGYVDRPGPGGVGGHELRVPRHRGRDGHGRPVPRPVGHRDHGGVCRQHRHPGLRGRRGAGHGRLVQHAGRARHRRIRRSVPGRRPEQPGPTGGLHRWHPLRPVDQRGVHLDRGRQRHVGLQRRRGAGIGGRTGLSGRHRPRLLRQPRVLRLGQRRRAGGGGLGRHLLRDRHDRRRHLHRRRDRDTRVVGQRGSGPPGRARPAGRARHRQPRQPRGGGPRQQSGPGGGRHRRHLLRTCHDRR